MLQESLRREMNDYGLPMTTGGTPRLLSSNAAVFPNQGIIMFWKFCYTLIALTTSAAMSSMNGM